MTLEFGESAVDAGWLTEVLRSVPDGEVWRTLRLGPSGFEAYARVLSLPDPEYVGQSEADLDDAVFDAYPDDFELLDRVIDSLAEFTASPDDLRFLLWDGWPYDPELPAGPRVDLARVRTCALAAGSMADWRDWSQSQQRDAYPPAVLWPVDRSWCVVYDVDSHFAGVAGAARAIRALMDAPVIEVRHVDRRSEAVTLYG